ncbi:MAG: general secretion pathway protein GspL [Tatlockia sp.]|nr:general secretion pathway protein GspL [Tatlockia sp.]
MATSFLFTQHLNESGCLCLKLDQQGEIDAPLAQRNFAEIKSMQVNSQTFIVAPAAFFSVLKLNLPWLAERKARAAIPFALEDKLAQNFDTLHFAFASQHYQNGQYLVVVTDKNYLKDLIATLDTQSINFDLLTIDWFALKTNELAVMESSLLVNDATLQGVLDADLAPLYFEQWSEDRLIYRFSDSAKELFNLPFAQIIDIQEPSYLWLARRLENTRPMNLCQGEFQHGSSHRKTKRLYQATAGMCLLWLVAVLAVNTIKLYYLNKDTAAVDEKIAVVYREFFPQAKTIINPKFRISQLIKTNQSTADSTFWTLVDKLAKTFSGTSVTIEQFRYQNQTITLTMIAKNFESLEDFQSKLQQNKVKVRQTQASTRDEQVISTLELTL